MELWSKLRKLLIALLTCLFLVLAGLQFGQLLNPNVGIETQVYDEASTFPSFTICPIFYKDLIYPNTSGSSTLLYNGSFEEALQLLPNPQEMVQIFAIDTFGIRLINGNSITQIIIDIWFLNLVVDTISRM